MKSLFITGITSGIGSEVLKLAYQKKWSITAVVRTQEQEQKQKLEAECSNVNFFICDMSQKKEVEDLCNTIKNLTVDYALLNAGIARGGLFTELESKTIDEQIQVNLLSVMHISKALISNPRNSTTKFGFVSSLSARWSCKYHVSYGVSKAGVTSFYKSLQAEHPKNPMVCFEIGGVDTGIHAKAGMTELDTDSFIDQQTIGRKIFQALEYKTGIKTLRVSWWFQRKILMIFEDLIVYITRIMS